ncbi:MAG: hypothetical protein JJE51_13120 [Thermoanaerobaculia bacterium]|nr:hypothetical protein [Thermoanaerobaculia bacterium]
MLRFHGWQLAGVLHDLAMIETGIERRIQTEQGAAQILVSDGFLQTIILDVHNAVIACAPYPDMRPAAETAQRSEIMLRGSGRRLSLGEIEVILRAVRESIIAELSREVSISIPRAYADHVDNEQLFGGETYEAFPGARADIRDAGNALAVGLDTSAVFHLMRAVEVALRALAREQRVRLPRNRPIEFAEWQDMITAVRTNVDKVLGQWKRGPQKAAALEFYGDLLNQFSGFKDAFRNHVMHSRKTYSHAEATEVIASVKSFFARASSYLAEGGKRINWRSR